MKQKCLFLITVFLLLGVSFASAESFCSFDGFWDVAKKEGKLTAVFAQGGRVTLLGVEKKPWVIDFRVDLERIKLLLFDITTVISGTASVVSSPAGQMVIEGVLRGDQDNTFSEGLPRTVQGKFEIREGKVFLKNCTWNGFDLNGDFSLGSPRQVDLVLRAHHVLLSDIFSWLGREDKLAEGDVSGEIHFSGLSDYLTMDGKLSSAGQMGDFRYDNITAGFEGFYPVVKLVETSVTQEGGISFFLEGNIDLSNGFKDFSEQLAKMKMLPLIRQTDVDREWTIRRDTEGQKTGETEFKYRLRREREVSGVAEGGMLTIERSIKF